MKLAASAPANKGKYCRTKTRPNTLLLPFDQSYQPHTSQPETKVFTLCSRFLLFCVITDSISFVATNTTKYSTLALLLILYYKNRQFNTIFYKTWRLICFKRTSRLTNGRSDQNKNMKVTLRICLSTVSLRLYRMWIFSFFRQYTQ